MSEISLIYNTEDDCYYVYAGETYIANEQSLADALQYFLPLITDDVTVLESGDNHTVKGYGKVVTYRRPICIFNISPTKS